MRSAEKQNKKRSWQRSKPHSKPHSTPAPQKEVESGDLAQEKGLAAGQWTRRR